MCRTDIYTYVHADGHREKVSRPVLCPEARYNRPCSQNIVFKHPAEPVQYSSSAGASYLSQFPPTPPSYTPRSSTPIYHSNDESDRSHRSSSSASRRRASGVYINGQRIMDLRRDKDSHRRSSGSRNERIVLVDGPPTPRTPPQTFTGPHTAPSSPSAGFSDPYIVDASPRQRPASSSLRRPVIVDERAPPQVEVVGSSHSRKGSKASGYSSSSSHDSRSRRRTAEEEQEKRQRRQERRERKKEEEEAIREAKKLRRIWKANEEISRREPVPIPSPTLKRSATTTTTTTNAAEYTRPSVHFDADDELVDAVRKMKLDEAAAAAAASARRREAKEVEAQRQRLIERMSRTARSKPVEDYSRTEKMIPQRRATVGPGSRRHRVLYDDGLYRWE